MSVIDTQTSTRQFCLDVFWVQKISVNQPKSLFAKTCSSTKENFTEEGALEFTVDFQSQ